MSDVELREEVVMDATRFECDVCRKNKDKEELGERIEPNKSTIIDICKSCQGNLPFELVNVLYTGSPEWKADAARMILFSIRDCDEAMNYDNFTINNMVGGVWAVFGNAGAEDFTMEYLDSIEKLESRAKDNEFNYRDYPRYLTAVLDCGELRQFKTEWKLVEVKGK